MIAVFDTNIVIDALNGITHVDTEYGLYERVLISQITWMEVMVGTDEGDLKTRNFLETYFEIIAIDTTVAEYAVQLRRTHRLRLPDAIIFATAKAYSATLVTRNTKDFKVEWDAIRIPYQL